MMEYLQLHTVAAVFTVKREYYCSNAEVSATT
jgi:hypothetical protein